MTSRQTYQTEQKTRNIPAFWDTSREEELEALGWTKILDREGYAIAFHRTRTVSVGQKEDSDVGEADLSQTTAPCPTAASEKVAEKEGSGVRGIQRTPTLTSENALESQASDPNFQKAGVAEKHPKKGHFEGSNGGNFTISATATSSTSPLTRENVLESQFPMGPNGECDSTSVSEWRSQEPHINENGPQGHSSDSGPQGHLTLTEGNFSRYEALRHFRDGGETLTIAYDAEWHGEPRCPLSFQFAVIRDGLLHEYVIVNAQENPQRSLTMPFCLGVVLTHLGLKSFRRDRHTKRVVCIGHDGNGKPVWDDAEKYSPLYAYSHLIHPLMLVEVSGGKRLQPAGVTVDEAHEVGDIDKYADKEARAGRWDWSQRITDYPDDGRIKIELVCHAGLGDLSLFELPKSRSGEVDYDGWSNLLRYVHDIQGGVISLLPTRRELRDVSKTKDVYVFPVTLTIRDTMAQTPPGSKSLLALGEAAGVPKLEDDRIDKSDMYSVMRDHTELFFEYASQDSVTTLAYYSMLYGINREGAPTLTSVSAKAIKKYAAEYLGAEDKASFERTYRGLEKMVEGLEESSDDRMVFIETSALVPISRDVAEVQSFGSHAFQGGYNLATRVGWYEGHTYDYDLISAYPTAMMCVPDIDWENPIKQEITKQEITLSDFRQPVIGEYPLTPFVGYVRFDFPEGVRFPNFMMLADGVPINPLSSEGVDGVYVTGVEVFLALKLGAKVICLKGYFLNSLLREDGTESHSLGHAVKAMVQDRAEAKAEYGKGSLEETFLKLLSNGGYGKVAQNVKQKRTWSTMHKKMEIMDASSITNPISAAYITAITRAQVNAVMNQLEEKGYMIFSTTTDGFITNAPEDVVKGCDMYGLKKWIERAREELTDGESREVWEMKHKQKHLLNLTTRANVGLEEGGVLAKGSMVEPLERSDYDSSEEFEQAVRDWMIKACLGRTGKISCTKKQFSNLKDVAQGEPFRVWDQTRGISVDFDLRRSVIRESMEDVSVELDGETYKIANFDTAPYRNVHEALQVRRAKDSVKVRRTKAHWETFWYKRLVNDSGMRLTGQGMHDVVMSCVRGHRYGHWTIKELDTPGWTVQDKIDWINEQGILDEHEPFTRSDWKNTAPSKRRAILPIEVLEYALRKFGAEVPEERLPPVS